MNSAEAMELAERSPRRLIIHVDMDCFYAAIEEREDPSLSGKPVAVGGRSQRGVLTTANYEARAFGCRSAMPVFKALALCPHLILLPVRFELYRAVGNQIREILTRFSPLIEPLSLDEAYLDVSHWRSSGAAIAREIRAQIREETGLNASAGIAPSKLVAKIASDWRKPNGQFEVRESEVENFMRELPVGRLWGVGGKMREKLNSLGIATCGDLLKCDEIDLARRFGRWGLEMRQMARGIDDRPVRIDRVRKSLSSERTLADPILDFSEASRQLAELVTEVRDDILRKHRSRRLKSHFVKLKFADFRQTTAELAVRGWEPNRFDELMVEAWSRGTGRAVRLVGAGVRFAPESVSDQLELFALDLWEGNVLEQSPPDAPTVAFAPDESRT